MSRTFVGIGFGPIQSGLFLLEAANSGNFGRLVVAEVMPEVVAAVRRAGGTYSVNIAEADGIRTQNIAGVEIYNPLNAADREQLVAALAAADEIATALPSVDFYRRGEPSPATLLADGFKRKLARQGSPAAVVYAAENHNHAAELLREAVLSQLDPRAAVIAGERVQFVNTVIGKMSGVVSDPQQIERDGLVPIVEGGSLAVLVEQFNRILIGRISLRGFERGIRVFQEKADLLPFEEAKLYGHNATHALLGYLAHRRSLTFMHETTETELLKFVDQAFREESGEALCRRHAGLDPLFTPVGWADYVQDLLTRMTNPHLQDRVDRIIRDSWRKLGWDDRLIGTMRVAMQQGVEPRRFAVGAVAALEHLIEEKRDPAIAKKLFAAWATAAGNEQEPREILSRIEQARQELPSLR